MKLRERKTLIPPIRNSPAKRKKLKINSSFDGDASILPNEIIQDILSRLPVKPLLRFKCVSKPWYALISDSKFARFHLLQSQKNSDSGTLFVDHTIFYFLKFMNLNLTLEKLDFPIKRYRELCSCDGIMLLKHTHNTMFAVWNPSTRTFARFRCPYVDIVGQWSKRYGLCYDVSSDDYKVVWLVSDCRFVVYSCKNNSWSEKKKLPVECVLPFRGSQSKGPGLFVNGALHWVTAKTRNKDSGSKNVKEYECNYENTYELCCFDPKDDKFKKMFTPFDDSCVFDITDLGGQLCLYIKTPDFERLDIWRMGDYGDFNSWTKLLTIENMPRCMGSSFEFATPLCLTNKSDVLLWIEKKPLVVYNPKEGKFRKMDICGVKKINRWLRKGNMSLDPCLCWNNSLVLPNRIKN